MVMARVFAFAVSVILIHAVLVHAVLMASGTQPAKRSQWDGIYTDVQADRGGALYETHCQRCHGSDLKGLPAPVAYPNGPASTPPLTGHVFFRNWSQMTVGDLLERIRISMPQENPGVLNRQQVSDVVAFLLRAEGYPDGATELSSDITRNHEIVFSP